MPESNGYVDVVCVDAMKTVFEWEDAEAPFQLYADAADRQVTTAFKNSLCRTLRARRREFLNDDEDIETYWRKVNVAVLGDMNQRLGESEKETRSQTIRRTITSDTALYVVRDDMRNAMERLSEFCHQHGWWLVLASNQNQQVLANMVSTFGLGDVFDKQYTPTNLGAHKPSLGFWYAIRGYGVVSKRILAMFGNSLENDAVAAKVPIQVFLHDRTGGRARVLAKMPGTTDLPDWVYRRRDRGLIKIYSDPASFVDEPMELLGEKYA
ncbi:MAG: hypothetical protein ABIH67_04450 [Candidatus Uhrbacteria bacterium]